jgi:tRNA-dihydrouridine synthase 4
MSATIPNHLDLIAEGKFLYVAAPMVRYSKLPFRLLCRRWGCDVTYTPMIVAEDFINSKESRQVEFTTNSNR